MCKNKTIKIYCISLVFISMGTINVHGQSSPVPTIDTLSIAARNNSSMILETTCFLDTLDEECETYCFRSPLVLFQRLSFTLNDSVITKRQLDILPYHRHKYKSKEIQVQTLPIVEIGVYEGKNGLFYYLYGSSFCCGVNCPEYIGIYKLDGTLLYEEIAALDYKYVKYYSCLEDFCNQERVDINRPTQQRSINKKLFHED